MQVYLPWWSGDARCDWELGKGGISALFHQLDDDGDDDNGDDIDDDGDDDDAICDWK